jgi:hypothetical protein
LAAHLAAQAEFRRPVGGHITFTMILPRKIIRQLSIVVVAFLALLILTWSFLPNDNVVYLAVRFNFGRLLGLARGSGTGKDAWLWRRAKYPLDLKRDVGLLIKTGYGTRQRVPAQLQAFGLDLKDESDFVVVGDFTQLNRTEGEPLIYDAVGGLLNEKAVSRLENSPRFAKYQHLNAAIEEGHEERAKDLGRSFGWELDALKVCVTF